MNPNELFTDNLRDTHWLGQVVDNNDPLKSGRCKIRVFGKFDTIENEFIPWASPANTVTTGFYAVPGVGEVVGVRFNNGNIYHPEYTYGVKTNPELKSEVLDSSGNPADVISLIYDAKRNVRVFYSPEDGLVMTLGDGKTSKPMIKLSNDGKIFLNADDIFISSNSTDESQPAVKGQKLVEVLEELINEIKTHVHPGPSVPMLPTSILKLEVLKKKIKSIKQTKKP